MIEIIETDTRIWANMVDPGMVIEATVKTANGGTVSYVIEVEEIVEGYNTWTFSNGYGRDVTVDYAAQVMFLGYFNPQA